MPARARARLLQQALGYLAAQAARRAGHPATHALAAAAPPLLRGGLLLRLAAHSGARQLADLAAQQGAEGRLRWASEGGGRAGG